MSYINTSNGSSQLSLDELQLHSEYGSVIEPDLLSILDDFEAESDNNIQFTANMTHFRNISISQNRQLRINMLQHDLEQSLPNSNNVSTFSQSGNLLPKQTNIDRQILPQILPNENENILKKVHQNQSITVSPINYISVVNTHGTYHSTQMQNDFKYPTHQVSSGNAMNSKKIQITCQPRSKYRPRTYNESKKSSHYIRCKEGAKREYPTIDIPREWGAQSNQNIIEVALMDIHKNLHPYSLENKASSKSTEELALIFKQNNPNILYFRLTNEDLLSGFKSFMIELIKSKLNDTVTKELIRTKSLHQSMLRFTRFYRDGYTFVRDTDSTEYSCVMTESYGDITIDHMGPQYGPMHQEQKIFIIFKGRIAKGDISIIISEENDVWRQKIKKIILIGNVIYFTLPPCVQPRIPRVRANITVNFKDMELRHSKYVYMNTIDQEIQNIGMDNMTSNSSTSIQTNSCLNDMVVNIDGTTSTSRKISKNKPKKRLNSK
ncbi:unnamed protein product [Adineta steineri]|uniref:Uncharacterized protein n=1 Tax=Adineta steineri TaxID=433720 RepID=A0A818I7E0_9BILA|nr:unnamed protein product [Adineta steineri]